MSSGSGGSGGTFGGWDPSLDESCGLCGPGEALVNGVCPGTCTGCAAPPEGGAMACVSGVCTPRCPAGYAMCGNACANLATSLESCGSCGAACTTGLCIGGVCNAAAARVLVATANFDLLALDATTVFYADRSAATIGRVAKTGGLTQTLATGEATIGGLAVDSGYVYWSGAAGAIKRVPKSGGVVQLVATGTAAGPVAVDGANVFWGDTNTASAAMEGVLLRAPVTGGLPTTIFDADSSYEYGVAELLLDGTYAYAAVAGVPHGAVARSPEDGSGSYEVVLGAPGSSQNGSHYPISLDQDYVYAGDDVHGGIQRRRKDLASAARQVVALSGFTLDALAVGDLYLYFSIPFTDAGSAGKALKCGGVPVWQPTGPSGFATVGPYGAPIVLDGAYVYTVFKSQLLRLPQ